MNIPRSEHPNPQFMRQNWICLNGEWQFEIDHGKSGEHRDLVNAEALSQTITVPFCPESKLSGIENRDFMECVWYKKSFELTEDFIKGDVILTVGACDYRSKVFVNGKFCTEHIGGYTPIRIPIGHALRAGKNDITICAYDDLRSTKQPSGKQSFAFDSFGCFYTRTTGIWQSVILESVPKSYIKNFKFDTSADGTVVITANIENGSGLDLSIDALFDGKAVASTHAKVVGNVARAVLNIPCVKLWDINEPNLYDVTLTLGEDTVSSYFGVRTIEYRDHRMYLNGRSIFGRFILDQGFYPDGVYTAPSDQALIDDIKFSMSCGYNGARLHEKIFEPRFLYHCDKMGYMVWGEHANWGLDISTKGALQPFLSEWLEMIERDYNHPSIIGWCPFNETQTDQNADVIRTVYSVTKAIDPARLFIDCSGWMHVEGCCEMMDCHNYEQNAEVFMSSVRDCKGLDFKGLPYREDLCFISEFGGARWAPEDENNGWGYGNTPKNLDEFYERYESLVSSILGCDKFCAFCYTQLTDVEIEKNGLFTFDRKAKFDCDKLKKITSAKSVVED